MPGFIRAAFLKSSLATLEARQPEVARAVRARMSPQILLDMSGAVRTAWIPVEHDMVFTEALYAELGLPSLRAFSRDSFLHAAETPLLSPVVRSADIIFGRNPGALLRWAPRMWGLIYRDCGRLRVSHQDAHQISLVLEDATPLIARSVPYLESMAGTFEASLVFADTPGTVVLSRTPPKGALFTCRWGEPHRAGTP